MGDSYFFTFRKAFEKEFCFITITKPEDFVEPCFINYNDGKNVPETCFIKANSTTKALLGSELYNFKRLVAELIKEFRFKLGKL